MNYFTTIISLTSLALSASLFANESLVDKDTPQLKGYEVAFSDEFNASTFNFSKWKMGINSRNAIQANKQSAYTKEALSLKDGILSLTARKEEKPIETKLYGGKKKLVDYSSGAINTDGVFHVQGESYIEIRCKFPENDGGFVAFWAQPTRSAGKENMKLTDKLEVDFFEFKTNLKKASHYRYFSSLWWHYLSEKEQAAFPRERVKRNKDGSYTINHQSYKPHFQPREGRIKEGIDFSKYVTIGFKATKDQLSWHIVQEGSAYHAPAYLTFKGEDVKTRKVPENENKPFVIARPVPTLNNYLILNYRVSNQEWLGGPIKDSQLPASFLVDYVRVYHAKAPSNSKNK